MSSNSQILLKDYQKRYFDNCLNNLPKFDKLDHSSTNLSFTIVADPNINASKNLIIIGNKPDNSFWKNYQNLSSK